MASGSLERAAQRGAVCTYPDLPTCSRSYLMAAVRASIIAAVLLGVLVLLVWI